MRITQKVGLTSDGLPQQKSLSSPIMRIHFGGDGGDAAAELME